jgi:KinB signaling pathway activation protein
MGFGCERQGIPSGSQVMTTPLRWYLKLLAALTILSGLGQLLFPGKLGAASAWGVAAGWQREIAFWDFAMYIVIVRTLRANDLVGSRTVAIALVALQLMVATNHAVAAIQTHATLNRTMDVVNYACVALGVFALRGRTIE